MAMEINMKGSGITMIKKEKDISIVIMESYIWDNGT